MVDDDLMGIVLEPGQSPGDGLVDANLSPQARQAVRTLVSSMIGPVARRAAAVFLGLDQYPKIDKTYSSVMAGLMLECLPAFVHEQQGEIAYSVRFGNHCETFNPIQSTVTVNGKTRTYLREGYVFLYLPRQRAVISADTTHMGGEFFSIDVRSNGDVADFWRRWEAYAREHNYLRGQAFFADGRVIDRRKAYTWENILLPENTRKTIQNHVQFFFQHSARLRQLGVKPRRGLILSGPPGTGKTLLGKVLADTLGVSFMWVLPRHVKEPQSFAEILSVARFVAPTLVFLEDLDLFAEEREGNEWLGLGELMNQLDGAVDNEDVVTIATTNRLDVIEKALRNRPGRFDRIVEIGTMAELCRRRLLGRLLAAADIAPGDFNHLLSVSEGYTGAQVEELVNTLYILALREDNAAKTQAVPSDKPAISISRHVIDAGLEEFRVERKTRLGFHAA